MFKRNSKPDVTEQMVQDHISRTDLPEERPVSESRHGMYVTDQPDDVLIDEDEDFRITRLKNGRILYITYE